MTVHRRRRALATVALLLGAMVLAAGCGQSSGASAVPSPSPTPITCDAIYQALGLRPSDITDSEQQGRCVQQNLQVSGEVSGQVLVGHLQDRPERVCAKPRLGTGFTGVGFHLDVLVASKPYVLVLRPPGTYRGEQSTTSTEVTGAVALQAPGELSDYGSITGQMTMDASGFRGSMDVELKRDVAGANPVHITGDWSCGSPPAQPSPDASVPCSSYFAAANSPSGGPTPGSLPCLQQALTFSGGLAFYVTEAVNPPTGFVGVQCGGLVSSDQQNYRSRQSFADSGNAYDLVFDVHREPIRGPLAFPDFGPSSESASTGGPSPSLTLSVGAVKWSSTAGTYHVNPDRKTGTVDMDLLGGLDKNQAVHVSGSWRCAA